MRQTKAANAMKFFIDESIALAALPFASFVVPPHIASGAPQAPQFVTPLAAHKSCCTPLLCICGAAMLSHKSNASLQRHIYRSSSM